MTCTDPVQLLHSERCNNGYQKLLSITCANVCYTLNAVALSFYGLVATQPFPSKIIICPKTNFLAEIHAFLTVEEELKVA